MFLCTLIGAVLTLGAVHFALTGKAQAFAAGTQAAYTPITLPQPPAHADKPKRNPFLAPVKPKASATAITPQPVLKGIVQNGSECMAIVEYAGNSGYYKTGSKIGTLTITAVEESSVLFSSGKRLSLPAGGAPYA